MTLEERRKEENSSNPLLETALEKMASSVAKDHVKRNCVLGLGSGATVARFAKALGERIRRESLKIQVVPSSIQAWLLAKENGLTLYSDTAHCPQSVDAVVDGADQIATESRAMIKGGGGALFKEKILLSSARKAFILGDEQKFIKRLERSVPVEVSQFAVSTVEHRFRAELEAEPTLRKLEKGFPFFTESGNVILDCKFAKPIEDPRLAEREIKMISGVVEAGIFNCKVDMFYKANHDGTFESL